MIYFIGDIHLQDPRDNADWAFNHNGLLSFIRDLNLTREDIVIQCGDLYHKTKHIGKTNQSAGKVVKYLSEQAGYTILLQGNHDCSKYSGSNLDSINLFDNVFVIKDINIMELKGYKFLLLPYIEGLHPNGSYESEVNKRFKDKKVDFIVGHHFFKENSVQDNPYFDIDMIDKDYKYFIQGHNHKFEKISDKKVCTGSICAITKDQKSNNFIYLTYDDDRINYNKVDPKYFSQFHVIRYSKSTEINTDIPEKDFVIVSCKCKREDRYLIDLEIRNRFKKNLYEIQWEIEDEVMDTSCIDLQSDKDLLIKFFEENKYTKEVKDLFWSYNGKS